MEQLFPWLMNVVVVFGGGMIIKLWIAHGETRKDVAVVKNDLDWLKTTLIASSKRTARILHSPHTPELDGFLEKYADGVPMTLIEVNRMKDILNSFITDHKIDKSVKANANIILSFIANHPLKRT